jgi:hypothetical protein
MSIRRRKRHLDHARRIFTLRPPAWPYYARAWLTFGQLGCLKRDPWLVYTLDNHPHSVFPR